MTTMEQAERPSIRTPFNRRARTEQRRYNLATGHWERVDQEAYRTRQIVFGSVRPVENGRGEALGRARALLGL